MSDDDFDDLYGTGPSPREGGDPDSLLEMLGVASQPKPAMQVKMFRLRSFGGRQSTCEPQKVRQN